MASDSRQTSVVHFLNGKTTTTPAPRKSVSERDDAMLTLNFFRAPLHHPSVIYLVMLNSSLRFTICGRIGYEGRLETKYSIISIKQQLAVFFLPIRLKTNFLT